MSTNDISQHGDKELQGNPRWIAFRTTLQQYLGTENIALTHRFQEDLAAESLDLLNITASLEESMNIHIPEPDLVDIHTVEDLWNLILHLKK